MARQERKKKTGERKDKSSSLRFQERLSALRTQFGSLWEVAFACLGPKGRSEKKEVRKKGGREGRGKRPWQ